MHLSTDMHWYALNFICQSSWKFATPPPFFLIREVCGYTHLSFPVQVPVNPHSWENLNGSLQCIAFIDFMLELYG